MSRYFFTSLVILFIQTGFYLHAGVNTNEITQNPDAFKEFDSNNSDDILFVVKHCKSPNVVIYKANKTNGKDLHPEKPIDVYWLMNTKGKKIEPITYIEWKMAFGFTLRTVKTGKEYRIHLNAIKNKEIFINQNESGIVKGFMKLNGVLTQLKEVFINFEYSMFLPDVKYVDFEGMDLKTGKIIKERFFNN